MGKKGRLGRIMRGRERQRSRREEMTEVERI